VKWYQLHLSTLLALMLLAAGLVWLNVRRHESRAGNTAIMEVDSIGMHLLDSAYWARGWPSDFEAQYDAANTHLHRWDFLALALNAIVCLLLLALAGAGIEWVTRRRERGKA
jgi:hypothetical protein